MIKTSIRFFEDIPVRAVWDEETSKWWFCATDVAEALTKSKNPRSYWNAIKRRNPQLSTICRQLKLTAKDGKKYLTDVVDEEGINSVIAIIPSKKTLVFDNDALSVSEEPESKGKPVALGNERLSYTMHSGGGVRDPARGIRLACSRRGHSMLCIPHHSQRRHDRTRLYPLCGQIFPDRSAVL